MKRPFLLILLTLLLGCQVTSGVEVATDTSAPTETIASSAPSATWTVRPTLLPTSTPPEAFTVRLHPEWRLYVGDRISFEVIAPSGLDLSDKQVEITVNQLDALTFGAAGFGAFGIGGRYQATMRWVWDTGGLEPGVFILSFAILPDGHTWTESVELLPASDHTYPEPDAAWSFTNTDCCVVYYVTGTSGERDLMDILEVANAQAISAAQLMGTDFNDPIPLVLLPRVLGHGGFAGLEIYITYMDRNYAGSSLTQVLHHEMVHILDGRLGGDLRPSLFVEGLAVYLSGGHFKPEPLMSRVAALLDLGWYLPLTPLADDFYHAQHEIGYMEGGALIQYIVQTWGYEAFDDFYRDIHWQGEDDNLQSSAIDEALGRHFDLSFAELEAQFLQALRRIPLNLDLREDLRLTVTFYNTVRRYQLSFDPSAYFLTAWLLGVDEMRAENIVADYVRHPSDPENLALETLLVAADHYLRAGQYAEAERALIAANMALEAWEGYSVMPFGEHPLAADHLEIVLRLQGAGYQPHRILVTGGTAQVWATAAPQTEAGPVLIVLTLREVDGIWRIE